MKALCNACNLQMAEYSERLVTLQFSSLSQIQGDRGNGGKDWCEHKPPSWQPHTRSGWREEIRLTKQIIGTGLFAIFSQQLVNLTMTSRPFWFSRRFLSPSYTHCEQPPIALRTKHASNVTSSLSQFMDSISFSAPQRLHHLLQQRLTTAPGICNFPMSVASVRGQLSCLTLAIPALSPGAAPPPQCV